MSGVDTCNQCADRIEDFQPHYCHPCVARLRSEVERHRDSMEFALKQADNGEAADAAEELRAALSAPATPEGAAK